MSSQKLKKGGIKMENEIKEIKEIDFGRILNDIRENRKKYKKEARFILFGREYWRRGDFPASREYKVIAGRAEVVHLHSFSPNEEEEWDEYAFIPRVVPTIILEEYENRRGEWQFEKERTLHIFDGDGWVSLPVKNG
jgi:hypothetical protein